MRIRVPSWVRFLLVNLFGVLLGLLCVEGFLRLTQPQPLYDPRLPYFAHLSVDRDIALPGVQSPSRFTTNRLGLRGDEPPTQWDNMYTAITIGGSTTRCTVLDDSRTWSAQLQQELQADGDSVWVGNAGADGQSTRGHLLVMESIVHKLHPDLVVVMAGINDMGLSWYEMTHTSSPFERFGASPIIMQSATARMVIQLNELATARATPLLESHRSREDNPITPEEESAIVRGDPAASLPTLAEYRSSLNKIVDLAQQDGIAVVLVTQASLFEDSDRWAYIDGTPSWMDKGTLRFSARSYARMLALFNQVTIDVCQERALRCLDLAALMPHEERYFYDEIHFTDEGAAAVAQLLAPVVAAQMAADDK